MAIGLAKGLFTAYVVKSLSDLVPHDRALGTRAGSGLAGAPDDISQFVQNLKANSRGKPVVPDHEMLRLIGQGAYGEVWLARNTFGEFRAVKIVWRRDFGDDDRPFQREFQGIRKFEPVSRSHPTQLAILHVGKNDQAGCFYYVMELADDANEPKAEGGTQRAESIIPRPSATLFHPMGEGSGDSPHALQLAALRGPDSYAPHTLRSDLKARGRLPIDRVIDLGLKLTEALSHLHAQGLVHRDVKPSNIVFVKGVAKLADIGLVTDVGDARSIVGTEGYLAQDRVGTPQADIFALGKVLYEAATGRDRRDFPDLPIDWPSFPDRDRLLELNEVIVKACASDPRERYANANEMRGDLALLQGGQSVRRKRAFGRRWKLVRNIALPTFVVALVGGLLFLLDALRDTDLRSAVEEVNILVARGNQCILSETEEMQTQGLRYFQSAVELDPTCAQAWFGLFEARDTTSDSRRKIARKLMQIAPSLAESHCAAARIKWEDWQITDALAEARAATRMRAGSKESLGVAHVLLGFFLLETGNPTEALKEYQRAERLLPSNPALESHLGHPYFVQRKFEEAMAHYKNAAALEPRHLLCHRMMAQIYEAKGDLIKAIDESELGDRSKDEAKKKGYYEELREAARNGAAQGYYRKQLQLELIKPTPNSYWVATYYAKLGEQDEAYKWLERALAEHNFALTDDLMVALCWDHTDKRFRAVASQVGLIQ